MTTTERECLSGRNVYDPRVRELVSATGNPDLFPALKIPKSTLRGWLNGKCTAPSALPHSVRAVVLRGILHSVDYSTSDQDCIGLGIGDSNRGTEVELYSENAKLRKRVRVLQAVMYLLLVLVRVTGCRLDGERSPDGAAKERLLRAIEKARQVIALASVLKVIGLSASRYHAWHRRDKACELTDRVSCAKKSPGQLTATEIESIRELATSSEYRHMPTSTLSRFAQRAGKVYASASTWLRLMRDPESTSAASCTS